MVKYNTTKVQPMQIRPSQTVFGATLLAMLTASNIALAEPRKHETRFSVKFGAIEVGVATFKINFDETSYSLSGSGNTTGLVKWFAPTTGKFISKGGLAKDKLSPKTQLVSVKESKKKEESVKLSFSGNRVTDIKIKANKIKKRVAPKYVPLETKHLAAVIDPVSALIVPTTGEIAQDGKKVCNQRFPVFDGETRYDIKLRYKSVKKIKTNGYSGNAYVCQMRYVPIAGHRANHRNTKEMAKNKNMEIWLAPMEGVSVFSPIKIVIGTKYGRFTANPVYFGTAG